MKYYASIKSYDPDDEDSEEFDTLEQAANWLSSQQPYYRNRGSMRVNGKSVVFGEKGQLEIDEPQRRDAAPSLASTNALFDRVFRPQSVRPTNVATLEATGKLDAGHD